MASTTTWGGGSDKGYDMSLWYDSRPLKIGWFAILGAVGAEVVFQRLFGYSHGLDSMTPEFENVWMNLWRFNVVSNIIYSSAIFGWLWSTRDRNIANVDPKTELKRYFYWMMWLACYVFGVYWAGSYTLEQDASWHQVIIRDTSFTASHIIAFYFTFPLYITMGVRLSVCDDAVAAVQQGGVVPVVGAIVGPMMILPNVGLNEWGHAFWFVDELFAAPLHWGFVTLGWCGLFGGRAAWRHRLWRACPTCATWCGTTRARTACTSFHTKLYRQRSQCHPRATSYFGGRSPV